MTDLDLMEDRKHMWHSNGLNPDDYSAAVGRAMQEYAEKWERQRDKWQTFDTPPPVGKQILVMWKSYPSLRPEVRILDEGDLCNDWSGLLWQPLPEPPKQ